MRWWRRDDRAPEQQAENPRWGELASVFGLALVVRLGHASFLSSTPFFRGPLIDALVYHQGAEALAAGQPLTQPFYQPPLATFVLSWLYRAGIELGWGVAIVQSIAGALTCVLLAVIAARAVPDASRKLGLTTGMLAALAGPLLLYDLELLPPVWVDLSIASALALALTGPDRASGRDLVAGVCLGLAGIGWVPSLVFGPALVFARPRAKRRWLSVALLVIGALLPLSWTAHHNATHGAPGALVSWNGGLNLWLGNNPDWRRTWGARPGAEFEPLFERPRREGAVTPTEQDRWFQRAVLEDVRERPLAAIGRTLEKLYYAWHGREIRRNQDYELLREASPILAALQWEAGLFFPFGLVAPLALVSLFWRRRERAPLVLGLSAIAYSLVLAAFFVATRYRLPMLMLLLPFAADTALRWIETRRPGPRELAAFAVALVALNLPSPFTASLAADEKERAMLTAMAWRAQDRDAEAARIAHTLLARYPEDPNVRMLEAQLSVARGDCASAVPHLSRVAEQVPLATTPLLDLARCHVALGQPAEADRAYARVLALDPNHPGALRGAAVLFMSTGRRPHAIMLLERLRANGQGDDGTDFDLGRLYVQEGRVDEALAILEPLARASPEDAELSALIERARARR